MPTLATNNQCTGCMACENRCPHSAIENYAGRDGHLYVRVLSNRCVECRLCEKVCPIINQDHYGANILDSQFYAGWALDDEIRNNGATAGIFGALAKSVLNAGGYVAGVVMNGLVCEYELTNSEKELHRIQGSKYTAPLIKDIYQQILCKLNDGNRVLFCGLPCHVAALRNYVPKQLRDNLFLVDLICGGVSSPLLIARFVQEFPNTQAIVSFRNKKHGWSPNGFRYSLVYIDGKGESEIRPPFRNLITDGFACELTERYSCYHCSFSFISRKSDLTLGDLWGDHQFPEEHLQGVSSIIVHSAKGEELVRKSNIELRGVSWKNVLNGNHRIYYGKSIKGFFPERLLLGHLIRRLSYQSLLRVYCSDLKTKNVLWWPFVGYRAMSFGIARYIKIHKSSKILKSLKI